MGATYGEVREIPIDTRLGFRLVVTLLNKQLKLTGHKGKIPGLFFTGHGTLVTGSHDREVRVWDLGNPQ